MAVFVIAYYSYLTIYISLKTNIQYINVYHYFYVKFVNIFNSPWPFPDDILKLICAQNAVRQLPPSFDSVTKMLGLVTCSS